MNHLGVGSRIWELIVGGTLVPYASIRSSTDPVRGRRHRGFRRAGPVTSCQFVSERRRHPFEQPRCGDDEPAEVRAGAQVLRAGGRRRREPAHGARQRGHRAHQSAALRARKAAAHRRHEPRRRRMSARGTTSVSCRRARAMRSSRSRRSTRPQRSDPPTRMPPTSSA